MRRSTKVWLAIYLLAGLFGLIGVLNYMNEDPSARAAQAEARRAAVTATARAKIPPVMPTRSYQRGEDPFEQARRLMGCLPEGLLDCSVR